MSVLSSYVNNVKPSSKNAKAGKPAKESGMKNANRIIVRCKTRKSKEGAKFTAWFMGVLTAPKFQLTEGERQHLMSRFWARPIDEDGNYARRTSLTFHCYEDKPGEGVRAWFWLADVTTVTPAEVKAWVVESLKPAKVPAKGEAQVKARVDAITKKAPATKVARSQKAKTPKVVREFELG
jgi:hypothetical protein